MTQQPLDLDAIEALTNAATPGPWFNDSHEIYAGPHPDMPAMNEWIGETCDPNRPDHGAANAALAAWSRDGVPALVADIRRLRTELHIARQENRRLFIDGDAKRGTADRLRAELQQAQHQLRLIDDEIEEFEDAAQSDPNTPASVLLMIQILRRIRPAAVSSA